MMGRLRADELHLFAKLKMWLISAQNVRCINLARVVLDGHAKGFARQQRGVSLRST